MSEMGIFRHLRRLPRGWRLGFTSCLPTILQVEGRYYSLRSAIIGSTLEARRAGIAHANPDTKPRRMVPARRMPGSRGLACAHFAMIWFRANERAIPAKIPAPRLTDAALKTIRSTSARCAPSAIRIPNSVVRCATV